MTLIKKKLVASAICIIKYNYVQFLMNSFINFTSQKKESKQNLCVYLSF